MSLNEWTWWTPQNTVVCYLKEIGAPPDSTYPAYVVHSTNPSLGQGELPFTTIYKQVNNPNRDIQFYTSLSVVRGLPKPDLIRTKISQSHLSRVTPHLMTYQRKYLQKLYLTQSTAYNSITLFLPFVGWPANDTTTPNQQSNKITILVIPLPTTQWFDYRNITAIVLKPPTPA